MLDSHLVIYVTLTALPMYKNSSFAIILRVAMQGTRALGQQQPKFRISLTAGMINADRLQLGLGFSRGLLSPTEVYALRILPPPPHPGYARPEECGAQGQAVGLDAEEPVNTVASPLLCHRFIETVA
jgi:hypothetical protein